MSQSLADIGASAIAAWKAACHAGQHVTGVMIDFKPMMVAGA